MGNKNLTDLTTQKSLKLDLPQDDGIEITLISKLVCNMWGGDKLTQCMEECYKLLPDDSAFVHKVNKRIYSLYLKHFLDNTLESFEHDVLTRSLPKEPVILDNLINFRKNDGLTYTELKMSLTDFLYMLCDEIPSNIEYYAKKMQEISQRRKQIQSSLTLITDCSGEEKTYQESKQDYDEREDANQLATAVSDIIIPNYIEIMGRVENISSSDELPGLPSGYPELDRYTGGWEKAHLTYVAGYSQHGKTSFTGDCIRHALLREKANVIVFSLEMDCYLFNKMMLHQESRTNKYIIESNNHNQEWKDSWGRFSKATEKFQDSADLIRFVDNRDFTASDIRVTARKIARSFDGDVGLVVVDSLQEIKDNGKYKHEHRSLKYYSQQLRALAKELNCPVMCVSRVTEPEASHTGRAKTKARMLRGSRDLEFDADCIILTWVDGAENEGSESNDLLHIGKKRGGVTNLDIPHKFEAKYSSWQNLAHGEEGNLGFR